MFTYKKNNIILIILLTLSTLAFSEELKIREDANMRISPNKNSEVIEVLSGNTDVHGELSSENENWYKIEYNDKIGYVHKSLVTKNTKSSDDGVAIIVIIIFVVAIVLLVISLRITILNRIFTILLHIGRLIFTILCMSSAILIADGDYVIAAVVFGCFTAFLTLYGIGASAFDDTRQETGNILMNPIEGGGYKLCAEVTGDSPLGTFISSLIWSAIVGGVVGFLLALLGDSSENMMYIIVLILSIIGIIRGIASLIQGITEL